MNDDILNWGRRAIVAVVVILIPVWLLRSCGVYPSDAEWVKSRAQAYYESRGFTILGYQGYNIFPIGKCYWYTLQRGSTVYESCLMRWSGEVHEYDLKAVDALKGTS